MTLAAKASKLPYWLHQLTEYLVGLVVLVGSIRQTHPAPGMVTGAVVLVLASAGDGPLAAFRPGSHARCTAPPTSRSSSSSSPPR